MKTIFDVIKKIDVRQKKREKIYYFYFVQTTIFIKKKNSLVMQLFCKNICVCLFIVLFNLTGTS